MKDKKKKRKKRDSYFRRTQEEIDLGLTIEQAKQYRKENPPEKKKPKINLSRTKHIIPSCFNREGEIIFEGPARMHFSTMTDGKVFLCLGEAEKSSPNRKLINNKYCTEIHKCYEVDVIIKRRKKH